MQHDFDLPMSKRARSIRVSGTASIQELCLSRSGEDLRRLRAEEAKMAELRRQQFDSCLGALKDATSVLQSVMAEVRAELDEHVTRIALEATRKILFQEVEGREYRVGRLIAGVLDFVGDLSSKGVRVKVHPSDLEGLERERQEGQFAGIPGVEIVADGAVAPGQCAVETDGGCVVTNWREQLRIVEEALGA